MYGCESWTTKKAEHWRVDAFELWCWGRVLRVPWTARRSVNPKENKSWIFIRRTDAEAEAPILQPPDAKSWLIGKDCHPGKDWRQEKGTTEDEMVGWHHWLNGLEFEQAPGDGDRQGGLACSSLGGCKESDTTEWLNNNKCRDCPLLPKRRELRHGFSGQFQANFYWNIRNIEAKGSHHKNSSALQTNSHPGWAHRINSCSKWNSGEKVRECERMKGRKDQRKDHRAYLITPKCTWYLLQKCRSYRSNPGNWGRCLTQIHKTGPIWALGSSLFK